MWARLPVCNWIVFVIFELEIAIPTFNIIAGKGPNFDLLQVTCCDLLDICLISRKFTRNIFVVL